MKYPIFPVLLLALTVPLIISAQEAPLPGVDAGELIRYASRRLKIRNQAKELEKAVLKVQQDPWNDDAWDRLGWLCLADGNAPGAEKYAQAALKIRPYHSRHLLLLAYAQLAQGKTEQLGLILARAQQYTSYPFNNMKGGDIKTFLSRTGDYRQSITRAMRKTMETNAFRQGLTRSAVLKAAAPEGRIRQTQPEPWNKRRLWIAVEGAWLRVYDADKGTTTDHMPRVKDLVKDLNVRAMIFTQGRILAWAGQSLTIYSQAVDEWELLPLPEDLQGHEIEHLQGIDSRLVKIRLISPERTSVSLTYAPAQKKWGGRITGSDARVKVGADPYCRTFAEQRFRTKVEKLTPLQAAAALSQHADLKTYMDRIGEGKKAGEVVTIGGGLSAPVLQEIIAAYREPVGATGGFMRGITLPVWNRDAWSVPEAETALKQIRKVGGQWVSLTPTGYQHDPLSTIIETDPELTASFESLEIAIARARAAGLKILLKPHVNLAIEKLDNHMWRGMIKFSGPDKVHAWFEGYQAFLMPYVDLAIKHEIELLTVGVEFWGMYMHEQHWRVLIQAVRQRGYKGKLTYAALHHTYDKLKFWDALDYISIDAYFEAVKQKQPSFVDILNGFGHVADKLRKLARKEGKQIIFTEVGYNNLDGCARQPWYWSGNSADIDNLEQAACYHAVLDIFPREPWFAGMFWWSWEVWGAPPPDRPSYSPQSKLAELILEAYYQQEPKGPLP